MMKGLIIPKKGRMIKYIRQEDGVRFSEWRPGPKKLVKNHPFINERKERK